MNVTWLSLRILLRSSKSWFSGKVDFCVCVNFVIRVFSAKETCLCCEKKDLSRAVLRGHEQQRETTLSYLWSSDRNTGDRTRKIKSWSCVCIYERLHVESSSLFVCWLHLICEYTVNVQAQAHSVHCTGSRPGIHVKDRTWQLVPLQ